MTADLARDGGTAGTDFRDGEVSGREHGTDRPSHALTADDLFAAEAPQPGNGNGRKRTGGRRCGDPDGIVGRHSSGEMRCTTCWHTETVTT
jgi:hypothetical protein